MNNELYLYGKRPSHLRSITFCVALTSVVTATSLLLIATAWLLVICLLNGLIRLPFTGWCVAALLLTGGATQAQTTGGLTLALYTKAGETTVFRADSAAVVRPNTSLSHLVARSYHRRIIKPVPDWDDEDQPVVTQPLVGESERVFMLLVTMLGEPNQKEIRWLLKK